MKSMSSDMSDKKSKNILFRSFLQIFLPITGPTPKTDNFFQDVSGFQILGQISEPFLVYLAIMATCTKLLTTKVWT